MKTLIAASIAALSFTVTADAGSLSAFSGFAGFGDSLSDKGRFGFLPAPSDGARFSNGPTWMELIGDEFEAEGLANVNMAVGGATAGDVNTTDGTYALIDLITIRDPGNPDDIPLVSLGTFDRQISSFVGAGYDILVGDNPLVGLLFGGNDFLQNLGTAGFNPTDVAMDIADGVARIADLDPKFDDFLVLNLPEIANTPANAGRSAAEKAGISGAVQFFNSELDRLMSDLATTKGISIDVFDLYTVSNNLFDNAASFGMQTDIPCTESLSDPFGPNLCPTQASADAFYFVDGVHPNRIVHSNIAGNVSRYISANLTPVPLPAGMPLLLIGMGAFGVARAARKAA